MKRLIYPLALLAALIGWTSCESYETYGDKKAKERDAISKYIKEQGIKVIDEATFNAQGKTTNVAENEYVRLNRTGVYMQIVRKGCGTMLENGKTTNLLCRFSEYNILADSVLVCNNRACYIWSTSLGAYVDCSQTVDKMNVTREGTTITATFVEGAMMLVHSSSASVPNGWLVPLNYVNVGRPESPADEVAKVNLIVPHSQGTADASASVYPCAYELTYEREK